MPTGHTPVDPALLDRLLACSTSAVADTRHGGVATLAPALAPVHDDCGFAGTVRTVSLDPGALWAPVQTLDSAREDEVVVVDTADRVDEAVWGELLSTYAVRTGVRGMVTNGAVRDVDGIADLAFPAFARAVTPRGPSGSSAAARNVPVTVGGAAVAPGDVLVGDASGVVRVERDAAAAVASQAEAVVRTEEAVRRGIDEGRSLGEAFEDAGMG